MIAATPIFGSLSRSVPEDAVRDSNKFLEAMGLDYSVEKVPALVGEDAYRDGPEQVPSQYHLRRDSDGRIVSLHTVRKIYTPLQPSDITSIFDYLVAEGFGEYAGAWQSHGGATETIAVKMKIQAKVPGDQSDLHYYLLGRNRHTLGSIQFAGTCWRPWCQNMFARIFDAGVTFRHTTNVRNRMAFAETMYKRTVKRIEETVEVLADLHKIKVADHGGLERVVDRLLGIRPGDRISGQKESRKDDLLRRCQRPDLGIFGHSLYDVFQAVTNQTTQWRFGRGGKTTLGIVDSLLNSDRGNRELEAFKDLRKIAGI